jgi:hypothetical protein
MEHGGVDEHSGMARPSPPRSRLIAGADVDNPTLRKLPDRGRPAGRATGHAQLFHVAICACKDERTEAAERIGGRPVGPVVGRGQLKKTLNW